MAKYKTTPFYKVQINENQGVVFDFFGEFETTDEIEAEALNALCPEYITCLDNSGVKPKPEETPKPKKAPAKKASEK